MKPEDTPSSSRRSATLAIGYSSVDRSRSPKSTKGLPSKTLKMHDEKFTYYCDPSAVK